MTNIIFFGTPEFVIPICDALLDMTRMNPVNLVGVVTAQDKPVGRKQIMTASPTKKWAQNHQIPVISENLKSSILNLKSELGILAAYGQILPQEIIDLFPKGILVIHPSLLPKYRGASPIQTAIFNGDQKTGCSIIKMDAKMDHGPIVYQFEEEIKAEDTSLDLYNRIFTKTADILKTVIPDYLEGKIIPQPQDETQATYTKILKKEDGFIPLETLQNIASKRGETSFSLNRMIRAYSPWPGVWTLWQGKRIKFLPNNMVQIEGKNRVKFSQFLTTNPSFPIIPPKL
jgi:methionyl-tRNA formyltransferase